MGRLSNPAARPVQRRLDAADVDLIAEEYTAGRSLRDIAEYSAYTTAPSPNTWATRDRAAHECDRRPLRPQSPLNESATATRWILRAGTSRSITRPMMS